MGVEESTINNDDLEALLANAPAPSSGQQQEGETETAPRQDEAEETSNQASEQPPAEDTAAPDDADNADDGDEEQEQQTPEADDQNDSLAISQDDLEKFLAEANQNTREKPKPVEQPEEQDTDPEAKVEPNTPEEIEAFDAKLAKLLNSVDDDTSDDTTAAEETPPQTQEEDKAQQEDEQAEAEPPKDTDDKSEDDTDSELAASVDDILASLEEPDDDTPPEPDTDPEPQPTREEIASLNENEDQQEDVPASASRLDGLLKEESVEDEAPPPQPEPQSAPQPAPQPQPQPVNAAKSRFSATHAILLINSVVLIVLAAGQFNFYQYAGKMNETIDSRMNTALDKTNLAVSQLREQLIHPTPMGDLGTPREYTSLLEKADAAFENGNTTDAGTLYRQILSKYPNQSSNGHVRFQLGECYLTAGPPRWRDAAEQFLTVMQKFPRSRYVALAHLRSARCHKQLGDADTARHTLLELLANEALYGTEAEQVIAEARYRLAQYYEQEANTLKPEEGN